MIVRISGTRQLTGELVEGTIQTHLSVYPDGKVERATTALMELVDGALRTVTLDGAKVLRGEKLADYQPRRASNLKPGELP